MIQSMTAFARAQTQLDTGVFSWEIRSVNHRYLDVSFRLPDALRFIEPGLRAALRDKLSRGKLECQLKYQDINTTNQALIVDKGMVQALINISEELTSSYQIANDMSVSRVLAWPGIVSVHQPDMEDLSKHALSLFDQAVAQLIKARVSEGVELRELILSRLQALTNEVTRSKTLSQNFAQQNKDKLLTRLQTIQIDVPEARVEQEIALILARLDVAEELDRLQTHCVEVSRALNCDTVVGRRLDFLMQELNREANTLSSKSDSVELTQSAVEMKVLIEQMREQIQNIE